MLQGDDDTPLFKPCFDILMGLGRLFQRKASVYDGFYLSLLDKLFYENEVFRAVA